VSQAAGVDPVEQARCRALTLAWLRFDLTRQQENARTADPRRWLIARRSVRLWQHHRDLAPVRDAALAALPDAERAEWATFWGEVDDLVRRIDAVGSAGRTAPLK
jgi:hypothetical protein